MTNQTNDMGGAAFPREDYQTDNGPGQTGMTLWDHYAAAALSGLIASVYEGSCGICEATSYAGYIADAMLAERVKRMEDRSDHDEL